MRDLTYPPVIAVARGAFKVMNLTFQITGSANIPTSGGAVLAFNHISYVDFVFGGFAARPSKRLIRFMAKRELAQRYRLRGYSVWVLGSEDPAVWGLLRARP
jgi:1-acyl-sn-glycerol-3-phosphate acyltransferase